MSVRHALLALLSEGPTYGLQLRQEFEARTGEAWPLNVGQVYTTLQRLERDGCVEAVDLGDGTQKAYAITGEGRHELDRWLTTPPDGAPPRDELVIKVLIALRLPGVDLPGLLQAHRNHLLTTMRTFTRAKEDAVDNLPLLLVADAELYRLDAAVRWLDTAEARLRQLPPPPGAAERPQRRRPLRRPRAGGSRGDPRTRTARRRPALRRRRRRGVRPGRRRPHGGRR